MKANLTLAAINAKLEAEQEKEHRSHLGASVLGKKCAREIWYGFRWSFMEQFEGRMLRLFKRGQDEENVFLTYLKSIGCETWEIDPRTGKQWTISGSRGHFGGSCDGVARGIPEIPGKPFTVEFKTHNHKSFTTLTNDGLCMSKPEHYAQAQIYTYKLGLTHSLYCGVNKNDDHLYLELLEVNPVYVETLLVKADKIIFADVPPPKISPSPAFYLCKFCKFSTICHDGATPEKNCRTCYFSQPVDDGKWLCNHFVRHLTKQEQHAGCPAYQLKPELLAE